MNRGVGSKMDIPVKAERYISVIIELNAHTRLVVECVVVERIAAVELYSGIRVMKEFLLAVALVKRTLHVEPFPSGLNLAQKSKIFVPVRERTASDS